MVATESVKGCSICGRTFPRSHFEYGGRTDRSYCQQCSKEEKAAYARGGAAEAAVYRNAQRLKWKRGATYLSSLGE